MHSTSNVTCPSNSSGIVAILGFYETLRGCARRFEVEDLASFKVKNSEGKEVETGYES